MNNIFEPLGQACSTRMQDLAVITPRLQELMTYGPNPVELRRLAAGKPSFSS